MQSGALRRERKALERASHKQRDSFHNFSSLSLLSSLSLSPSLYVHTNVLTNKNALDIRGKRFLSLLHSRSLTRFPEDNRKKGALMALMKHCSFILRLFTAFNWRRRGRTGPERRRPRLTGWSGVDMTIGEKQQLLNLLLPLWTARLLLFLSYRLSPESPRIPDVWVQKSPLLSFPLWVVFFLL